MVKCAIPFITVAKRKRYCKGVKSIASEPTISTKKIILFTPGQYLLLYASVIKGIALSIFNRRKAEGPSKVKQLSYKHESI